MALTWELFVVDKERVAINKGAKVKYTPRTKRTSSFAHTKRRYSEKLQTKLQVCAAGASPRTKSGQGSTDEWVCGVE